MATALHSKAQEDDNLETYSLVWLDASVNELEENIQAQKQLRTSINHLRTFENDQKCLQYIKSVPKDDRIILIVSGKLGQIIVPTIINYRQIISIYVYCMNKMANEQWAKQFNKVKAVIVKLDELIHRIRTDQHERKHNKINDSLPICPIKSKDDDHGQSTTDCSGEFLYSQRLIDCLIKMKSSDRDKNELISLCKQRFKGNATQSKITEEFDGEYSSDRVLWWYTRDSFLYQMLNKALRVQNIHLLFLFRFIIRDIEQQLQQNKCTAPVHVYRAQLMSNDEVQMLKDSLGELIAINSFFSTSLNRQQVRSFLLSGDKLKNVEQVLFEIDADPRLENIRPFGNISSFSYYPEEQEVLFMIGSIFRLMNIDRDKDGILTVRMKLCSLNNHYLNELFQHMQNTSKTGATTLLDFVKILRHMSKWDDAEKYCHRLLSELPDNHKDRVRCYHALGSVAYGKGDYESSLKWYNKALERKMRTLKADDPSIASSYNSLGNVYEKTKDYTHALESYEKALTIYKRAYDKDHLDVAVCMNNMGSSYRGKGNQSRALELYQQALSIREKHLPANHYEFGVSHGNIGNIYEDMGDYDLALSHYNLELKIYQKSRPSQHPCLARVLRSIGLAYEDKGDFHQALSYFERSATIYRQAFTSTHPDVVQIEKDIRRISSKLK